MEPSPGAQQGLTSAEAAERLRVEGRNEVGTHGRRTRLSILASQFASPLVLLLVGASVVSIAAGDAVEAGIILLIVVLSAALGFVQEARSAAAVEALAARLTLRATAVRDGAAVEVPLPEVVRGDVVVLAAGDIVPADGRLLEANHLYVDESSLTGESAPVAKAPDGEGPREAAADAAPRAAGAAPRAAGAAPAAAHQPSAAGHQPSAADARPPDGADDDARAGLVFSGTSVVSGSGRALVTATGSRTAYGEIARTLAERAPATDFQAGIRAFGLLVVRVTMILVVAVFAVNVALQRPLLDALLFSIALAVGLTPELLPAIVTLNLTRGARALAARGVLVKRLPAIQNLGSLTILCTDKTGTLTEGVLRLVRSSGIDADDAAEAAGALELAFLNSHFQAGFANPLDKAILAGGAAPADLAACAKVAEIPYDFERRLLTVVVRRGDGAPLVVTKGAAEAVLARSTTVRGQGGAARPITAVEQQRLRDLVDGASRDGYRLVAVASRALAAGEDAGPTDADADVLESGLTFEGVILFSDPPKAGVGATIASLESRGIALKVVTGDSDLVARHVAGLVGLAVEDVLTGDDLRTLSHPALVARARRTTIFARVDPTQKLQVIRALRESGAVVGYLGDGINDAPPLHAADVGISVDNATDVARAAADLILLESSLAAIETGVVEGRRTFANTLKYIRMGTSSNFGNMLSMAGAALLLPFLPMTPGQILLNNLIYDASQTAIPTDDVDPEESVAPVRWDIRGIERFMVALGPVSSAFDFLTFGILLLVLGSTAEAFRAGWFIESMLTQILVVLVIRTRRVPFWRSRPSRELVGAIVAALAVAVVVPVSPLGSVLGFGALPAAFWPVVAVIALAYLAVVEVVRRRLEPPPAAPAASPAGSPWRLPGRPGGRGRPA